MIRLAATPMISRDATGSGSVSPKTRHSERSARRAVEEPLALFLLLLLFDLKLTHYPVTNWLSWRQRP